MAYKKGLYIGHAEKLTLETLQLAKDTFVKATDPAELIDSLPPVSVEQLRDYFSISSDDNNGASDTGSSFNPAYTSPQQDYHVLLQEQESPLSCPPSLILGVTMLTSVILKITNINKHQ